MERYSRNRIYVSDEEQLRIKNFKIVLGGTGLLHNFPVSHTYVYDNLYRLTEAHGTTGSAQTGYDLAMSYDNMYRITGKTQSLRQTGIQFAGTLNAGYDLAYAYDRAPGRRFRMSSVSDVNYRTVGAPEDGDYIDEEHFYEYDPNGNIIRVNTSRMRADGGDRELTREEKFRWDEENRLMAISQDGYVSNYWYDADGERVIKEHGGNQAVFVNSEQDGVLTDTRQFTIYPSAYLTVHNGSWYTKHIYIGSERIASRMGTMLDALSETFEANAILAGENVFEDMDYDDRCDTLARVMRSNYAYFDLPYNGYNRHGEEMVSTPPQSGAPVILGTGGPRHYWMLADADAADADTEGGEGCGPSRGPRRAENVNYNGNRYFYHSDHLGSSSLITDASGNVTQQIDYLPYGEVFLEKRKQDPDVDYFTPYKFNGKELDEETGLYYYGARYMNPRLSIWYATDPMQEKYPHVSSYCFTADNPVILIDDDGQAVKAAVTAWKYIRKAYKIYKKTGKLTPKNLKQAGLSEIIDIAGDLYTVFDGNASVGDKLKAGFDLVVGTDLNNKGKKEVVNIVNKTKSKIKPNGGDAKPHGGKSHNERIDDLIDVLKSDKEVTNIRKNQKQVDINGNVVGNNRPDVQFDKNGRHTNVEYDTRSAASDKHKRTVSSNDPNSRNKFYRIKK